MFFINGILILQCCCKNNRLRRTIKFLFAPIHHFFQFTSKSKRPFRKHLFYPLKINTCWLTSGILQAHLYNSKIKKWKCWVNFWSLKVQLSSLQVQFPRLQFKLRTAQVQFPHLQFKLRAAQLQFPRLQFKLRTAQLQFPGLQFKLRAAQVQFPHLQVQLYGLQFQFYGFRTHFLICRLRFLKSKPQLIH